MKSKRKRSRFFSAPFLILINNTIEGEKNDCE